MRYSDSASRLTTDFSAGTLIRAEDVLTGNLESPRSFGTREGFLLKVPVNNDIQAIPFAFAVHAVDDSGQTGELSNVVQATLRQQIPAAPAAPADLDAQTSGGVGIVVLALIVVGVIIVVLGVVTLLMTGIYLRKKSSDGKSLG